MNAAIYARYSSLLQSATSLEDQVRLCHEAAAKLGYTVRDGHVLSDQEISGATPDRPGYRRLLELARAREIDAILVESQDRLWRDQAEMHRAIKQLRFWNVRVISITTNTDLTDRTGGILATIVGLKDELFLSDLRDKTRRGMTGAIHRGLSVGGRAFGYRSEPVQDETRKTIGHRRVIDSGEAEVVRYIFRLYSDGLTPRAIAHRLNAERVSPPRGARGRKTGSWTPATITGSTARALGILNNPMYTGKIAWNRSYKVRNPETDKRHMRPRPRAEWVWVDAPELRILPDDLWERVQARRQQRRFTATGAIGGARPKYLLSGLVVCGECGGRYGVQFHRAGIRHYGCAVHFDRGPVVCANGRLIRQDVIEKKILDHVFGNLFAPHRLAYLCHAVDAALERRLRQGGDVLAQREAALRDARRELANIATAIRQGVLTPTTRAMLEDAERRVAALEQAVSDAKRRPAPVASVQSVVERYLRDLRATLETNVDEARRLLRLAIETIVLRREGAHLVARVTGNLTGLLSLGDQEGVLARVGAGRGI